MRHLEQIGDFELIFHKLSQLLKWIPCVWIEEMELLSQESSWPRALDFHWPACIEQSNEVVDKQVVSTCTLHWLVKIDVEDVEELEG